MKAEVCLEKLLQNIDPLLQSEVYTYCTLSESRLHELFSDCLCIFRENESYSAILPRTIAERAGLETNGDFRQIVVQVYSGFHNATGLTAVIAGELADRGVNGRVVATLRHHYVFVPEEQAREALRILRGVSNRAQYS